MVKVKQSPGKKSKPAKVPYKTEPHDFDGTQFVDARASELFHSYFNNHHIIAEREVSLADLPTTSISSHFTSHN